MLVLASVIISGKYIWSKTHDDPTKRGNPNGGESEDTRITNEIGSQEESENTRITNKIVRQEDSEITRLSMIFAATNEGKFGPNPKGGYRP